MLSALLHGDARALPLKAGTVQCVVTSPPYWGLRDYGLDPLTWGGEVACAHEWGPQGRVGGGAHTHTAGSQQNGRGQIVAHETIRYASTGSICSSCGGWRGCLGLEPTPELYVEHLVDVFREVRRVLRDDGTCWLNLGDCYATGAGSVGDHPGGGEQGARWRGDVDRLRDEKRGYRADRLVNTNGGSTDRPKTRASRDGTHAGKHTAIAAMGPMTQPNRMPIAGLKPKDLVGIPWRVAFALQADGWWLRRDIIWSKPNPMPESVRDRPTTAHEYVFLLTKAERYHYDADAIREPVQYPGDNTVDDLDRAFSRRRATAIENRQDVLRRHVPGAEQDDLGLGFRMPTKWNNAAGRNKRSVWTIATEPYPEAHFATFPEALVEPCILAGCPEGGAVLDPFAGSGTVGAVCARLGRRFVGVELSAAYLELAKTRTAQVGLL